MTRRIPIVPTVIVALAIATMIYLGFWQLGRAHERDAIRSAQIARIAMPATEFPYAHPADTALLYRHVTADCARVERWSTRGGESAAGTPGWRQIATCASGKGQGTFDVDAGIARAPGDSPAWAGGRVRGMAILSPDLRGPFERLTGPVPERPLMIIADTPAPGLAASKQPDPREEGNSSWSYTGQWFLFAITALVIYVLAVRKRWRAAD